MEKQLSLLDKNKKLKNKNQVRNLASSEIEDVILSKKKQTHLLLQLFSVIYEPVSITKLLICIKALNYKKNATSHHSINSLKELLLKLAAEKKVIVDRNLYFLNRAITESTALDAITMGNFKTFADVVQKNIPLQNGWHGLTPHSWEQSVRELRIALYLHREEAFSKALDDCHNDYGARFFAANPLYLICFKPFRPDWFASMPISIISPALFSAFDAATSNVENIDELNNWLLKSHEEKKLQLTPRLFYVISTFYLLKGDITTAKNLLPNTDKYHQLMLQGWITFLEGETETAILYFEDALKLQKKITKKRKVFIDSLSGIFYILALLRRGNAADYLQAEDLALIEFNYNKGNQKVVYWMLIRLFSFFKKNKSLNIDLNSLPQWPDVESGIGYYFQVLILYWADKDAARAHYKSLEKCSLALKKSGYHWIQAECDELLSRLKSKNEKQKSDNAASIRKKIGFVSIIDIIIEKEPWERTLDALTKFNVATKETVQKKSRLIWKLQFSDSDLVQISPKEQKQNMKGGWSAGRSVSLKRLSGDQESFTSLTDQDIQASRAIVSNSNYWHEEYEIDFDRILPTLVGHPLLFSAEKNAFPIELVKGVPEIQVSEQGKYLNILMNPNFNFENRIALIKESETRWRVIESTPEQQQLAELIGGGLKIPKEAKEKVLASLSAVAPFVNIHSDIGGGVNQAENVDAVDTLHMLISPMDEGLKIEARTRIFGKKGPYYHPGIGGKTIIAEVEGKQLQTTRDLTLEKKNVLDIIKLCPELSNLENSNDEWAIFDPETCLEILVELKDQEQAIVSWPEGEKLKINQTVSLADFNMAIKKENDWFSASGELKLDDGQVLNMKKLMELTKNTKGRFISLAEGQYIALTDTFKSRIAELHAFGDEKDGEIKLHPLAAIALDDMASESGKLTSDRGWKNYIKKFHEAMNLAPEVPTTLQAELRSYQKEGYQWLVRLAHWGVGACLADDMGLGKTVQAIALLLHRVNNGPALVVAPTSVAMNWMDEIVKFAPTLNIIDYRESDRKQVLDNLNAYDIVICSYGLVQNDAEIIGNVKWATIILDEAQAIKNAATKRSQAVMNLQAEVKIVMTGTPIENHLGELWNLFRFINPGLLGSMEKFNQRYANPIVKDDSIDVRQKLKKLIHPYILRRTKTQVLKELPSRTEITLHVDMSKDEAALYEALRRDAVEKFEHSELAQGHRQLQILAEITRLRRACCNPSLVLKVGAPASSKLALFAHVIEELLNNNHKALVFSQFVDHLSILKEKLDSMKVKYQYLDGSTPAKQRKKRVNEFQSGIGDVFLISLKAGGVGLNLTAADYVIHMDPWWNPAVEDQASDRAHRIGQKRPVTVYRMITKNTIEEKIVAMHKGKRDLADNLLAGADVSGKVNVEELLNLLKES